jgi:hypothetical protein
MHISRSPWEVLPRFGHTDSSYVSRQKTNGGSTQICGLTSLQSMQIGMYHCKVDFSMVLTCADGWLYDLNFLVRSLSSALQVSPSSLCQQEVDCLPA